MLIFPKDSIGKIAALHSISQDLKPLEILEQVLVKVKETGDEELLAAASAAAVVSGLSKEYLQKLQVLPEHLAAQAILLIYHETDCKEECLKHLIKVSPQHAKELPINSASLLLLLADASSGIDAFEALLKYHKLSTDASRVEQLLSSALQLDQVLDFSEISQLVQVQQSTSENAKTVKALANATPVDHEKSRLIQLADFAFKNIGKTVSFQQIATSLKISQDKVEEILLDGMRAGIIECRIDQLKSTVLVTRAQPVKMGISEYKILLETLEKVQSRLEPLLGIKCQVGH